MLSLFGIGLVAGCVAYMTPTVAVAGLGLIMFVPLIGAIALKGGSLLPVSATLGELWSHFGYGWRDIGLVVGDAPHGGGFAGCAG